MKLLICTQLVDEFESTLGFFHAWIKELAYNAESVEVICLQEGTHNLPSNVRVHSLGKESISGSRLSKRMHYIWRLLKYAWQLRRQYDAVLVHMNQEYLLTVGWLWLVLGKRQYLWRNHYDGSLLTDIAAWFCTTVFCTSRFSYTARYAKTHIMPVGVDMSHLPGLPTFTRQPNSILLMGRISPSKNIHLLIGALSILHQKGAVFTADIYGKTDDKDVQYHDSLEQMICDSGLTGVVDIHPPIPKNETYTAYRTHEISVNVSKSGMLDKTMFSGMMHGCLLLVSNKDLEGVIPPECIFTEESTHDLAAGLERLLLLNEERREKIRATLKAVVTSHALPVLAEALMREMGDNAHAKVNP